jgi:hypothetical protein
MSWKTTGDKERFFDDLDKAFNTKGEFILPQLQSDVPPKRHSSHDDLKVVKRHKSAPSISTDKSNPRNETPKSTRRSSSGSKRESPSNSVKKSEPAKKSDLLTGMILFFIPNSKKNGVRRYRMNLFAEHGAEVRDTWGDEITHVICDKSVTGERVLRDLQLKEYPVRFFLISLMIRLELLLSMNYGFLNVWL